MCINQDVLGPGVCSEAKKGVFELFRSWVQLSSVNDDVLLGCCGYVCGRNRV